jgi:hypothetical protein
MCRSLAPKCSLIFELVLFYHLTPKLELLHLNLLVHFCELLFNLFLPILLGFNRKLILNYRLIHGIIRGMRDPFGLCLI